MNRKELVDAIADKTGATKKDVDDILSGFIDAVKDELKSGGSVSLVGFGTFKVNARAAREGRNPQTGESIKIAARKVPAFKAGKDLKDSVN